VGRACGKQGSEQKYRVKEKGKVHSITGHEVPEWEYSYSCTLDLTSALDGGEGGQRHALAAFLPVSGHPWYRRLGGPRGRSGRMRKMSPAPGFDSQNVEPVASRYAD
jgi:hypothetical protein